MKPPTAEQFLKALEASRLLSPAEWEQVSRDAAQKRAADAESLARNLVRGRLLTTWQAGLLLQGRTAFFLGKYKLLQQLGKALLRIRR